MIIPRSCGNQCPLFCSESLQSGRGARTLPARLPNYWPNTASEITISNYRKAKCIDSLGRRWTNRQIMRILPFYCLLYLYLNEQLFKSQSTVFTWDLEYISQQHFLAHRKKEWYIAAVKLKMLMHIWVMLFSSELYILYQATWNHLLIHVLI